MANVIQAVAINLGCYELCAPTHACSLALKKNWDNLMEEEPGVEKVLEASPELRVRCLAFFHVSMQRLFLREKQGLSADYAIFETFLMRRRVSGSVAHG